MFPADLEAGNCRETKQQVRLEKLMQVFPGGEMKYQGYKK